MIPWVWAVNGACSVMGLIIAWGPLLNFGYNVTIWAVTAIYAIAGVIIVQRPSERIETD